VAPDWHEVNEVPFGRDHGTDGVGIRRRHSEAQFGATITRAANACP
jgi:hypothetical protein